MSAPTSEQLLTALADALGHREPPCAENPKLWLEPTSAQQVALAQEGCARCPGAAACLAFARRVEPVIGVWAGVHMRRRHSSIEAAAREHGAAEGAG